MCSGGGSYSASPTVVPTTNVSDSSTTASAAKTTAKKQRGKSGIVANTIATDAANRLGNTSSAAASDGLLHNQL